MLKARLGQLVFGCDIILNTPFLVDWGSIGIRKKIIIGKTSQLEKKIKQHTYIIQDKVLVRNKKANNYEEPYIGPYLIT